MGFCKLVGYGVASFFLYCGAAYTTLPSTAELRALNPRPTAVMKQRSDEARRDRKPYVIHQRWVALDSISAYLTVAAVVGEDRRFFSHRGIDWHAMRQECHYHGPLVFPPRNVGSAWSLLRSVAYCARHIDRVKGRSTITQQVVKNVYYGTHRSVARKAKEFVLAPRLEKHVGKSRILEIYLNTAEFGPGIFGAEAAAEYYFHCSAAQLSREQAVELAATLPQPLTGNPALQNQQWLRRRARIDRGLSALLRSTDASHYLAMRLRYHDAPGS